LEQLIEMQRNQYFKPSWKKRASCWYVKTYDCD